VAGIKLLPGQKMIGLGCAQEVVGFIRRLVGLLAAVSEVLPRTPDFFPKRLFVLESASIGWPDVMAQKERPVVAPEEDDATRLAFEVSTIFSLCLCTALV
jgi:hypothetical protein